ncbi:sulfur carrier protein ThiS [Helicobacter saguini]|uniref:Sulfur carrier protein ThiS n=1 Tax=Helicobacter saguini TaxID=1548018 RepID=A0A347VS38_9HELI|nr:sulfur carrier protein ThiS [Helicobacter saguini]MWV62665.1 sulfur carrier protein ThiS [Helicobacter saguini]MWV66663.1 sulfur carrier protein ThiS [Helicobacter saguini]MWV69013.1 sulfur carrier protein ThiS [Helicobacter saguini]MWV71433.1 sulfur carrier protein ThiS [Helicobacter saguini]TLD94083.1 sulfur carrier protein ThiS [Helicobacter saguini]
MKVVINGVLQELDSGISLIDALKKLGIDSKVVAIALNSNIVKKPEWSSVILKENDTLELLQFVSGG